MEYIQEFAFIAILAVVFIAIKHRTQKAKNLTEEAPRTDIQEAKPHELIPKNFISPNKREQSSDDEQKQRF